MTTAEMLRREGEARGEVLGKRDALVVLLRQRFGRLPATATARIAAAGVAEMDAWFSRVLDASSLDEVLAAGVGKGASSGGGKGGGGKGCGAPVNAPSTTGKPSGGGRGNNPPR